MRMQDDENILDSMESSTQVIMSDGLDLDLGVPRDTIQLLHLDDNKYMCSIKRAKASRDGEQMVWEFDVDSPGLGLSDLLQTTDMLLQYDDEKFILSDEYEINLPDIVSTLITFRGRRIVNNHE